MKRPLAAMGLIIFLGGCATGSGQAPMAAYPAKGQSAQQQSRDISECQAWAKQQTNYDPATDALKGAAVGTLLGGALGAGGGAAIGAVVGGLAAGVGGGAYQYSKSKDGYDRAYGACMQGRGYSVAR